MHKPSILVPDYWQEAKDYLASKDATLAALFARYPDSVLQSRNDPFQTLARAIVGQQVSVHAADAIWARLITLIGQQAFIPETVFLVDDIALQSTGLSMQKRRYLRALAEFFLHEKIQGVGIWDGMADEEVIRHITQVKGIGRWSAEMFLIFCLLRPDVFPLADIGLQRALHLHYIPPQKPFPHDAALELAKEWQPFRTVALWYLWRAIDPNEVSY